MHRHALVLLLLLALAPACSDEEPGLPPDEAAEPAPSVLPDPPPDVPTRYLRVELARDAAGVTAPQLAIVDSPWALTAHRGGDHVLVAYAGGQPVAAQPFKFPTTLLHEGRRADGRPLSVATSVTSSRVSVLVPLVAGQPLERLAVLDDTGRVLLEQAVPAAQSARFAPSAPDLDIPGTPALTIITPATAGDLPSDIAKDLVSVVSVASLPAAQTQAILEAFAAMAPRTRDAVTHLVVARFPNDGLESGGRGVMYAFALGGYMVLNAAEMDDPRMIQSVVHEAAHAYEFLLGHARDFSGPLWQWPDDVRELALATMAANQLQIGFVNLWETAHASGFASGVTKPYVGQGWYDVPETTADEGGFVESYGAQDSSEDIATYAAALQYEGPGQVTARQCAQLRTAPAFGIPRRLYIPYAKILLLASAGFIDKAHAEACYGSGAIHGPPGIVLHGEDDVPVLTLSRNIKGGWIDEDGGQFLIVLADGESNYNMSLRILAPDHVPPIGLHRLDNVGFFNFNAANNAAYLGNRDRDLERTSNSGLVLVSSVTDQRVEMIVFDLTLRSGLGIVTDHFPMSTFVFQK